MPKVMGAFAEWFGDICIDPTQTQQQQQQQGEGGAVKAPVRMNGVVFQQVNEAGPFCRLVDPTVDLAASHRALKARSRATHRARRTPWSHNADPAHRVWHTTGALAGGGDDRGAC